MPSKPSLGIQFNGINYTYNVVQTSLLCISKIFRLFKYYSCCPAACFFACPVKSHWMKTSSPGTLLVQFHKELTKLGMNILFLIMCLLTMFLGSLKMSEKSVGIIFFQRMKKETFYNWITTFCLFLCLEHII